MKILWIVFACGVLKLWGAEAALSSTDWSNQGSRFFAAHRYKEAGEYFEKAWQLQQQQGSSDRAVSATVLTNLAATRRVQARYPEAEHLYLQALSFRANSSFPDWEGEIITLKGLTLLYLDEGNDRKAEEFGRRVLALREQNHCAPAEVADALTMLSLSLLNEGRFDEAEALARKAVKVIEVLPQPPDDQLGAALNTLGRVSLARSEYSAAEKYFEHAAALTVRALGSQSTATAAIWSNLAKAKLAEGDWRNAMDLFNRSLGIFEAIYGSVHPNVASILGSLAGLYCARKKFTTAEPLYQRALQIDLKIYGENSGRVAADLSNLGSVAFYRHHLQQAEQLFVRALQIDQAILWPDHPDVGANLGNLAVVYWRQKRFEEAGPLFAKAAAIRQHTYGPQDPGLVPLLSGYASALRANRQFSEAEMAELQANSIRVKNILHPR
jgi:tetratricopeptide (TPR) repeat protein